MCAYRRARQLLLTLEVASSFVMTFDVAHLIRRADRILLSSDVRFPHGKSWFGSVSAGSVAWPVEMPGLLRSSHRRTKHRPCQLQCWLKGGVVFPGYIILHSTQITHFHMIPMPYTALVWLEPRSLRFGSNMMAMQRVAHYVIICKIFSLKRTRKSSVASDPLLSRMSNNTAVSQV